MGVVTKELVGQAVEDVITALRPIVGQPLKPGVWTPVQTLDHLIQVHRGVVLGLRAKEALPKRAPYFVIRRTMVGMILRNAIPVPAKGGLPTCDPNADFETKADELRQLQSKIESRATEDFPPNCVVMKHPIAGPLNLPETLAIVHAHLTYHLKRSSKGLASAGK